MPKIKIEKISCTNKKKDGTEMPNGTLKVGLKTTDKDGNEVWLNGIVEREAMTYEVGQEVDLEIENTQYGLQFKAPTLASIINAIDNRLRKVEMYINSVPQSSSEAQNSPVSNETNSSGDIYHFDISEPNKEISVSDIPF